MQGRETLEGEEEGLGNLGLGNELFGYYFEELGSPCPWAFLLVLSVLHPRA